MTVTIPLNNISSAYTELDNKKPFEVLMANPSTLMRTPSEGFAKLFKKLLARVVVEVEASIVDNKIEITNFAGVVSSNNGHHYLEFNSKVILDSAMWDKGNTIKIFFGIETTPNDTIAGSYPLDNLKIYAETQDLDELLVLTVDLDTDGNLSNLVLAPTASISAGGGGGASSFVELTDTPDTIEPNKLLIGNQDGTGIVQIDAPNDCSVISINNYPEIQTKLYPSQQITTQDIQVIIDQRVQLLQDIQPQIGDSNIGIIYKCIRVEPDNLEIFPINKGILEYVDNFTYNNNMQKIDYNKMIINGILYDLTDPQNIQIIKEFKNSSGSTFSVNSFTPNFKRVISNYDIYDYDEDNGYYVNTNYDLYQYIDVCGRVSISLYSTEGSVSYKYFTSTSADDTQTTNVGLTPATIDGWEFNDFVDFNYKTFIQCKPNDIYNIGRIILYSRDNNGITEYILTYQRFKIDPNTFEQIDNIIVIQTEPFISSDDFYIPSASYLKVADISGDNTIIIGTYSKNGEYYKYICFWVKDEDDKYIVIKTDVKGYEDYTFFLDNSSHIIIQKAAYDVDLYKLNLKPSLICMEDRTVSEVQDIDLTSFGSSFTLVRYISGIGSNQSEMDIVAVDDSNLKAISILDNEIKQDITLDFTPTMLSSSSNLTIVADDSNVKIFDMADGSTVKTISDSNINNVDVYSTTHYGISKDTNYKLYNISDDSIVVDITVSDVSLMVLDKKKEFIYCLKTVIDNGNTTITVSRYDASNGNEMTGNTVLSYSDVEYIITDAEINGNSMLLTLNNSVIKAYCVEDIENVKEICSYDAHYSNDFKWTTNMNNIICLKDNVTLTSLSMEN